LGDGGRGARRRHGAARGQARRADRRLRAAERPRAALLRLARGGQAGQRPRRLRAGRGRPPRAGRRSIHGGLHRLPAAARRAGGGKGGVVRHAADRREALVGVAEAALSLGAAVLGFYPSGLLGPKGNRETFIWLAEASRAGARSAADLPALALEVDP